MTIRKKLERALESNGLFQDQAVAVVQHFESSPAGEPMKGRLDEDETAYPPQLFGVLWISVQQAAVEWIDANKPQHWARAVFAQ